MKLRGPLLAGGSLGALLLAVMGGQAGNAEPSPQPDEVTYGSYWVPFGPEGDEALRQLEAGVDPSQIKGLKPLKPPSGPTNEKREQRISEEYGERGVTYYVDSADLDDDDQPSR